MLALCLSWQCPDVSSPANPRLPVALPPGGRPAADAASRRAGKKPVARPPRAVVAAPRKTKRTLAQGPAAATTTLRRSFGRLVELLVAAPSEEAWGWALLLVGVLAGLGDPPQPARPGRPPAAHGSARAFGWGADVAPAALCGRRGHPSRRAGPARPRRGPRRLRAPPRRLGRPGGPRRGLARRPRRAGLGSAGRAASSGPPSGAGSRRLIGVAGASVVLGAVALAAICGLLGMPLLAVIRVSRARPCRRRRALLARLLADWVAVDARPAGRARARRAPSAIGDAERRRLRGLARQHGAVAPGIGHVSVLPEASLTRISPRATRRRRGPVSEIRVGIGRRGGRRRARRPIQDMLRAGRPASRNSSACRSVPPSAPGSFPL